MGGKVLVTRTERMIQKAEEKKEKATIYDLVETGLLTPENGARYLDISVESLRVDMTACGFHSPE